MPDLDCLQPVDGEMFESTYPKYEFSELVRLSLALAARSSCLKCLKKSRAWPQNESTEA